MELACKRGGVAAKRGDFGEALKHYRTMMKEAEKLGDRERARAHSCIGYACQNLQRYKEAERAFRKSLELWEGLYGSSNVEVTCALNNIALARWHGFNDKAAAMPLLERAVELLEQAMPFGTDHTPQKIEEYSHCFLNLAELYEESGMSGKAHRLYKLALDVNIEAAGETGSLRVYDPALLYTLHLISRGDFTEAEAVWKKAIAAMRQFAVTTSDTDLGSTQQASSPHQPRRSRNKLDINHSIDAAFAFSNSINLFALHLVKAPKLKGHSSRNLRYTKLSPKLIPTMQFCRQRLQN
jgi:tetratricopeptide (TPR) repeat protein